MSPNTQLRWTIITALAMWAPAGLSVITGHIDIFRGGLLFVGALVISYIGLSIIGHLLNNYQRTQEMVMRAQRQIEMIEEKRAAEAEEDEKKRRAEDK